MTLFNQSIVPDTTARYFSSFKNSFRENVHQLIAWGYQDARPRILTSGEEEPDITSLIVEAIQDRINYTSDLPWVSNYSVQDGSKLKTQGALGKTKVIPDITIELCGESPHPVYLFEAKRLRSPGFTVGKYVENGGLDCFTTGLYAVNYPEAAMLGYVQSHSLSYWKENVKSSIAKKAIPLELVKEQYDYLGNFAFPFEWISEHSRLGIGRPISIYHILLDCT